MTVLIPTHGRPTLLKRTLESLQACKLPESYHELVVIENGSRDGAEELIAKLPERLNARYMYRERGNKSYALNEALKTIEDGLAVFFDDDVRVHPDTLGAYAESASRRCKGYFYGGPIACDYESKPPEWLISYLPYSARGWPLTKDIQEENWKYFLGFNWAAFVNDLRLAGGFDTNYGPGGRGTGQETEMQHRLLQKGASRIFVAEAKVWHWVPEARCNPNWALNRSYKNGISRGFERHYKDPSFMGIPRWAVAEIISCLYNWIKQSLYWNSKEAFDYLYKLYEHVGVVVGVTMKRLEQ